MFKKILCPIDFSPGSEVALRLAARMAAISEAELLVVHARYRLPPLTVAGAQLRTMESTGPIDSDRRSLANSVASAAEHGAKRVSGRVLEGLPWERIVSVAHDEPFDLVVIGTSGLTGLARFMLGSVAEKVVRHAPCSVLVARARGNAPPFRRILCPIDFSESSREAVRVAGTLVAAGGSVMLMHALQLPSDYGLTLTPDMLAERGKHTKHDLEEWAAQLEPRTKTSTSSTMGIGNPAAQALAVVDEDPAYDLIAVGSHGRTGVRRALLGSVAERLVRHAPCSVLVARNARA